MGKPVREILMLISPLRRASPVKTASFLRIGLFIALLNLQQKGIRFRSCNADFHVKLGDGKVYNRKKAELLKISKVLLTSLLGKFFL